MERQVRQDADPLIIQDLDARGLMFRSGTYSHTYPFCWRCDTPLDLLCAWHLVHPHQPV